MFLPSLDTRSSPDAHHPSQCGFAGNNDIYGLGIRLGIYSQMLAVFIANYMLPSQAQLLRDGMALFSIAILIVTLLYVAVPGQTHAVEVYILLLLLTWACVLGVRPKAGSRVVVWRNTVLRNAVNESINIISMCLHVWFWFRGLDVLRPSPCGTPFLVFVIKTDMYGWGRTVAKVWCVTVLVWSMLWSETTEIKRWAVFVGMGRTKKRFLEEVRQWDEWKMSRAGGTGGMGGLMLRPQDIALPDSPELRWNALNSSRDTLVYSPTDPPLPVFQPPKSKDNQEMEGPGRRSGDGNHIPDSNRQSGHEDRDMSDQDFASSSRFPLLKEIHDAELFLKDCLSATYLTYTSTSPSTSPSNPQTATSPPAPPPPTLWLKAQLQIVIRVLTLRFPIRALVIVTHQSHCHIASNRTLPFQVMAGVRYPSPPSHRAVALATILLPPPAPQSQNKVRKSRFQWNPRYRVWYNAFGDAVVNIYSILVIELLLVWSHVDGVVGLWGVGQLVPFVIGVGGLGLVVGRWVWVVTHGVEEKGKEEEGDTEDRVGMELGLAKEDVWAFRGWRDNYLKCLREKKDGNEGGN